MTEEKITGEEMTDERPEIDAQLTAHDHAVRLMASWMAAIADQVKNPVAGISAAAGLIEKQMTSFRASQQWDPAIVEEAVRLMLERLSRFDNYLAELSGFTRPTEIHSKWFDLSQEWPGIEQFLARRVAANFKLHIKFSASPMIYGDIERVKSVFAVAILNAVEACGSTINPQINVWVDHVLPSADVVGGCRISVTDNGPGFTKDALVQGLIPFFTTKEAGTGLGLAMAEKYVRAHGGRVKIDNGATGGVVEMLFPSPEA